MCIKLNVWFPREISQRDCVQCSNYVFVVIFYISVLNESISRFSLKLLSRVRKVLSASAISAWLKTLTSTLIMFLDHKNLSNNNYCNKLFIKGKEQFWALKLSKMNFFFIFPTIRPEISRAKLKVSFVNRKYFSSSIFL